MHSTLRTELRGTQRVFELLRSQPAPKSRVINRPFSSKTRLRQQGRSSNNNAKPEQSPITPSEQARDLSPPRFRPAELGSRFERRINELSRDGQPLHIWETISLKDEQGKWKLSAQAKQDLEEVDNWARNKPSSQQAPFKIKIEDGRIQALDSSEQDHDQENNHIGRIIQGPFVAAMPDGAERARHATQQVKASIINQSQVRTTDLEEDLSKLLAGSDIAAQTEPATVKFHGSAAARRQRSQRQRERNVTYTLPQWFNEQNISLWDMKQPDPSTLPNGPSANSVVEKLTTKLPSLSNVTAAVSNVLKSSPREGVEANVSEKAITRGEGGNGKPAGDSSSSGSGQTTSPSSKRTPILVALPGTDKKYYIEEAQHNELLMTARGRLRTPASGSFENEPGGIRGHLMIHYASTDADILLDKLVEDMKDRLHCDLITLDVQDITSFIAGSDLNSSIKSDAALLSYEVYNEIYKDDEQDVDQPISDAFEEVEEMDDESASSPPRGAFPFILGKPIQMDIKALFDPRMLKHSSSHKTPSTLSEIIGQGPQRTNIPPFSGLVDSILSSTRSKRSQVGTNSTEVGQTSEIKPIKDSKIIHIKNLRHIQDTLVGVQFLKQLFEQVESRRAAGESIMLVGTECSRSEDTVYDKARIRDLQSSAQDEISSTIVLTPPNSESDSDLSSDRARRIATINARNLWQMLQSKNLNLETLKPGFWTKDLTESVHDADRIYLAKGLWSFAYVQRLASIIANPGSTKTQHPIADAAAIIEMSDKSKFAWAKEVREEASKEAEKGSQHTDIDRIAGIRQKATKHEKKLLSGVVESKKIPTTFNDIHIPPETVDALQTLTTLSLVRPDAFQYGVLASDRIPGLLLYGPPGTGKTLAAKAVARESGATMLEVSAADINDMYVGEGEKNVKALFSLARKLSPCVVFLDEADAMFSARSNSGRRTNHRELLNQFLREWDGMSNDSGSAFIMVATNRPMDLDDAVLRRLPRRLLVDLPTETDRLEILKIHLRQEKLADDVNLSQLAAKTPFYSGSDLKNVAVSAALNAVREENELAKNSTEDDPYNYPAKRTLKAVHFERALEEISASISEDMSSLRDIKKFDEQYGDRKGRKRKSPKWGFKTAREADKVLDTVKVRS